MIKELFKKTLDKMVAENDFDKLITYTNIKTEKKEIETYKAAIEQYGAENLPIWPLIMNANAPVLRTVLTYMLQADSDD